MLLQWLFLRELILVLDLLLKLLLLLLRLNIFLKAQITLGAIITAIHIHFIASVVLDSIANYIFILII